MQKIKLRTSPTLPRSHDKAFESSTFSTVLGIRFDSSDMSWKLPEDKWSETIWLLTNFLDKNSSSLLEFQKLHGKINDFAQIGIFLKGFRFFQNNFLQAFESNDKEKLIIPAKLKSELNIWLKCILDSKNGFPIPLITENIPLFFIENFSDAAGAAFSYQHPSIPIKDDRGAAAITIVNNRILYYTCTSWSYELICKYPHNSPFFEDIGLVMPFIMFPDVFAGKFIKCNVDIISLIFNWEKRCTKKDDITFCLIQTLHILQFALPCKIFIDHSPRRSSKETILVDNLSRSETTTKKDLSLIASAAKKVLAGPLAEWCTYPKTCTASLPTSIVDFCMSNLSKK